MVRQTIKDEVVLGGCTYLLLNWDVNSLVELGLAGEERALPTHGVHEALLPEPAVGELHEEAELHEGQQALPDRHGPGPLVELDGGVGLALWGGVPVAGR